MTLNRIFDLAVWPFAVRCWSKETTSPELTLQGTMPRESDFKQTLYADMQGFSLHAALRSAADDRQALEQLCRTITRPALANERVQCNAAGQVVLKLKRPGATAPRTRTPRRPPSARRTVRTIGRCD